MIYKRTAQAVMGLLSSILLYLLSMGSAHAVFINEIHYDNVGSDSGEAVELSGVAGIDLTGWSLVLYNGGTSSPYSSVDLSGVFGDMQNGMGVLDFGIPGLQNGAPDGIALVDNVGEVTQFLSYEGTLTADSGIAAGMTSSDIGVAEKGSTFIDAQHSLQLIGSGRDYADFSWASSPMANTFGEVNHGQEFLAAMTDQEVSKAPTLVTVPEPTSLILFLLGLLACFLMRVVSVGEKPAVLSTLV